MRNLNKIKKLCVLNCCFALLLFIFTSACYALNLDNLKANLIRGDYRVAINEGEKLIAKDSHSDELYYLLGLGYLKNGNYLRSSDIFEVIIKEFSGSRFKEEARLGLGDSCLLRNDLARAEESYQELLKSNPNTKFKAQLFYRLSEIGFKKGDLNQGKDYLAKLKEDYPLNPEVKQNRDIWPVEKNNSDFYYSVQVGSFSNPVNAANLNQKLLSNGYPAYIEESPGLAGSKNYRVKVGRLSFLPEAEELDKKLKIQGYPTKICP
ncbi:MAG: tetratricopeptide repeat protein [Candidatus Omnitrophica bacterium]|nr:tetratricopeptide repeat protein [Candidatus Omnitrophota bacterium]MDD5518764.1 tetratricopeptide repeat protein [Candidatus Omnitrophota bacterium]